jgi:mannose-6-phosphate isomerase-like protein (cupin superfamily)
MRWALQPGESPLFGPERGCREFEQRVLRFDGPGGGAPAGEADEVLYVLRGSGRATVGGEQIELSPGTAVYRAARTPWRVDGGDGLEVLSVLVREPLAGDGTMYAVIGRDDASFGEATAGRMFRLLATPEHGCASATQFVGYIPVGRAPDHYHRYDEVVYVLEGEGTLHVDGETAPLRAGTCVHLPAGLVHCLENSGPGELQVLGVFRPAGSPAEAYYPDGTPAAAAY